MFFSTDVLSIKSNSGLGVVWLAGTLGQRSQARRLQRRDYVSVDIATACSYLMAPPEPLSLRLSASLMVGVVRVYGQQCNFCYGDATALYGKLEQTLLEGVMPSGSDSASARRKTTIDLDMPIQRARHDAITINGNPDNDPDLISSGNVWSELEKYKTGKSMQTPEVERGRQLSSAGGTNKSDSTNNTIPGRITNTPLQFGADEDGLLRELFGDLADFNDLQTPHSDDNVLSGIFHHVAHPGSLLDVPDTITVEPKQPSRRKALIYLIDDPTMLSREEMFQEPLLKNGLQLGYYYYYYCFGLISIIVEHTIM